MKKKPPGPAIAASILEIDALLSKARELYRADCLQTLQLAKAARETAAAIDCLTGKVSADYLIGKAQLILHGAEIALPQLRSAHRQAKALDLAALSSHA